MDYNGISKFLCLILRHKPDVIGISIDRYGWANVDELIRQMKTEIPHFDRTLLEEIVRTDNKQRYSFNEDKTLIRANQGHSIPVDVELEVCQPPKYLFHGTGQKYIDRIEKIGIMPQRRLYVHLSSDIDTAINVGSRHGSPAVLRVAAQDMVKDGYIFYKSVNNVWLTDNVPVRYLTVLYRG